VRTRPSSDDAHDVVYFKRHHADDSSEAVPGQEFLAGCPTKVRATMRAVLVAVAAAPPKRYSGGGYWEAMKVDMTGWFEVRVDGPKRHHYRLFCRLDKPCRTELSDSDYAGVRQLGDEYLSRNPRSIA
jgi:hypothetical protein